MDRISRQFAIILFLSAACQSPPEPTVSKSRWVECWIMCGKGDNLIEASNVECTCRGGYKTRKEEPKPEEKPLELFDWLMK